MTRARGGTLRENLARIHNAVRVKQRLNLPHQIDARRVLGVVQSVRLHDSYPMFRRYRTLVRFFRGLS